MASISPQLAPSSFVYVLAILNQIHYILVVDSKASTLATPNFITMHTKNDVKMVWPLLS
jgi:hypothetical protein